MTLFEVIVSKGDRAFGCTFSDAKEAKAYSRCMTALGFEAELSPEFGVYTSAEAVADTLSYFNEAE